MAKQPSKPQSDESAATPAAPPRSRRAARAASAAGATSSLASSAELAGASDTFAARATAADSPRSLESQSMGSEPSEEDIRLRAYQRYLERGGDHGGDLDDWIAAERELRHK